MSLLTSPSTGTSLLLKVKHRDATAWSQFAELYGPLIYAWSRRGGLSSEDAADAMQETLLAVAGGLGTFQHTGPGSFRAWLWAITTNKVRDHYRRTSGKQAVGGTDAQQLLAKLSAELPDEHAVDEVQRDLASVIQRSLAQVQAEFEPQTWQAFALTVLEAQDTAGVAAQLQTTAANVRQARSRILRRLREQLGDFLS